MAGHSKWHNIQHRKGRQDAKRAKIFTKISKEIFVSVRNGGDDPNTNLRLRAALNKAKEANMPKDNIEHTIKKATGDLDGVQYDEITYEGYGPNGVAVLVEALTDNRNRTAADVRHIFSKNNGNLGESGCVSFLFSRKGILTIRKESCQKTEDDLMLEVVDQGAEDFKNEGDEYHVILDPSELESIRAELETRDVPITSSKITMLPTTTVDVHGEEALQMLKLLDALEDNDDVQNVYANFEIDDEELEKLTS